MARYSVVLPRHWLPAPGSSFRSARKILKSPRMAHPTKTISWKAESKNGAYYLGMVEYAIDVLGFELRVRSAADGEINGNGTVRLEACRG